MEFTYLGDDPARSETLTYDPATRVMAGSERLAWAVRAALASGDPCGCNYWGEIDPSLDTPWQAYLTICGAIRNAYGTEPFVDGVPDKPGGYEPEGPELDEEPELVE